MFWKYTLEDGGEGVVEADTLTEASVAVAAIGDFLSVELLDDLPEPWEPPEA